MMSKHTEEFANCTINIEDNGKLTIQNKVIDYEHDADSGTWSSHYLPYSRYNSLLELARAIAGETLEFADT